MSTSPLFNAIAFVSDDVPFVVSRALQVIPEESTFHQTIADVIRRHQEYADDWRDTWFEIEKKWSADVGSPHVLELELHIDSELVETFRMPSSVNDRRFIPVWRYQLDPGPHEARLEIKNPTEGAHVWLDYAIIYADSPR